MEKRAVIEPGRTPDLKPAAQKQAAKKDAEALAAQDLTAKSEKLLQEGK